MKHRWRIKVIKVRKILKLGSEVRALSGFELITVTLTFAGMCLAIKMAMEA
ncbi:hypothetical protein [Rummeliibacillus stabekisii]|uniref:hypothetical protein n=1 Tax=Rummeliibacillus stabekisii TaxID=241244 RepID=UPI001314903C|nr:hypothetical protein [Rummeliibacillus stabekisii]